MIDQILTKIKLIGHKVAYFGPNQHDVAMRPNEMHQNHKFFVSIRGPNREVLHRIPLRCATQLGETLEEIFNEGPQHAELKIFIFEYP